MNANKKITDFIKLEDGNIGRKAATVTGALLASTVLGAVLVSTAEASWHCNYHDHGYFPWGQHRDCHGEYFCGSPCVCDCLP
jgi:hypothetical protein